MFLYLYFVLPIFLNAHKLQAKEIKDVSETNVADISSVMGLLQNLQWKLEQQEMRFFEQEKRIELSDQAVSQAIMHFEALESDLRAIIDVQAKRIDKMEKRDSTMLTNSAIEASTEVLEEDVPDVTDMGGMSKFNTQSTDETAQFVSFGCINDIIVLSCPSPRTIDITGAYFGEYRYTCGNECCPPHPVDDCAESVPVSKPADWAGLIATCYNKTACEYEYRGSTFAYNCTLGNTAQYMEVFYNCIPESNADLVAFTACATQSRSYLDGASYLFDTVLSNFGEHYQTKSHYFICPYSGAYVFSATTFTLTDVNAFAQIKSDRDILVSATAKGVDGTKQQATNTAIVECSRGQKIWIKATFTTDTYSDGNIYVNFGGYLLKTIE